MNFIGKLEEEAENTILKERKYYIRIFTKSC